LECTLLFLCPLANPAHGANSIHDSAKEPTRIFAKKNIHKKKILVRVTKIWQNNSCKKDFCKNKDKEYHN
jgi:hypothetical protein